MSDLYVSLDTVKSSASLEGYNGADTDVTDAIAAACRAVDEMCDRKFYLLDPSNDQTRYYTPVRPLVQEIDDLVSVTSVRLDQDGDGVFERTLTLHTDYELTPLNAALDGRPWEQLEIRQNSGVYLPVGVERSIEIVASFGWTTPPGQVVQFAKILAVRYLMRTRTAPFGVVGFSADGAVRIAREDPDLCGLISPLKRHPIVMLNP